MRRHLNAFRKNEESQDAFKMVSLILREILPVIEMHMGTMFEISPKHKKVFGWDPGNSVCNRTAHGQHVGYSGTIFQPLLDKG